MDLGGWDTIFTASAVDINAVLASPQTSLVRNFQFQHAGAQGSGTLGRWSIVDGGSESYLLLRLEIASGTFSLSSGTPVDIAGSTVTVRVDLKVLPTHDGASDQQVVLDLSSSTAVDDGRPITGVSIASKLSQLANYALCEGVAESLCAQAASFSFALATIDPSIGSGSWVAPVQHACIYVRDPNGGLGPLVILGTVSNRDISELARRLPPELAAASGGMRVVMTNDLFLHRIVAPAFAAKFAIDPGGFDTSQNGSLQYNHGIDLPSVSELGITFHPVVDELALSIESNKLRLKVSGHCEMLANINMRFTSAAQLVPQIDPHTSTLHFVVTGEPSFDKDVDIPWYD